VPEKVQHWRQKFQTLLRQSIEREFHSPSLFRLATGSNFARLASPRHAAIRLPSGNQMLLHLTEFQYRRAREAHSDWPRLLRVTVAPSMLTALQF
jgi:hypothetical protein